MLLAKRFYLLNTLLSASGPRIFQAVVMLCLLLMVLPFFFSCLFNAFVLNSIFYSFVYYLSYKLPGAVLRGGSIYI